VAAPRTIFNVVCSAQAAYQGEWNASESRGATGWKSSALLVARWPMILYLSHKRELSHISDWGRSSMFRRSAKPKVDRDYLVDILETAGFPVNDHNVDALARLVGMMLLAAIYTPVSKMNSQMAEAFLENNQWKGQSLASWPSEIYAFLAEWVRQDRKTPVLGPGFERHVNELPGTIRQEVLETANTGGFLGRPRSEPLPMDWRSE
jgi:hypothetical protein